jgi:regulatory protein
MVELPQTDEFRKIFDHAVKLVSLRLHGSEELRRKLLLRKYNKNYVDLAINRLVELKVLNDEQFAENYLENLIRYKTYGFYGLKMKLLQRGLPQEIITRLLEEKLDIGEETKIAEKFIGKTHKEKDKLTQSLRRKGFRSEVIAKVLRNMV